MIRLGKQVALGILLPTVAASASGASFLISVPAVVSARGGGLVESSAIITAYMLGVAAGAALASRVGSGRTLAAGSAAVASASFATIAVFELVPLLAVMATVAGAASSAFGMGRVILLAGSVSPERLGTASSFAGAAARAGDVIGPLAAALAISSKTPEGGLWASAGLCAVTAVLVVSSNPAAPIREAAARQGMLASLYRHRAVLVQVAVPASAISLLRTARVVVLPLWGAHASIDPALVAVLLSASSALDALFLFGAGWIVDRFGILWALVPAGAGMSASLALLPLSANLLPAPAALTAAALIAGVAAGFSGGLMSLLGVLLAPDDNRPAFLSAYLTVANAGMVVAPAAIGAVATAASLPIAVLAVAVVGGAAVTVLGVRAPRFLVAAWKPLGAKD